MSKPWYRSKTIWFNLIVFASSVLGYIAEIGLLTDDETALALAVVSVLQILLRMVTKMPIEKRLS